MIVRKKNNILLTSEPAVYEAGRAETGERGDQTSSQESLIGSRELLQYTHTLTCTTALNEGLVVPYVARSQCVFSSRIFYKMIT